jgi:adenosine deaminase
LPAPVISGIDLAFEYHHAAPRAGLTPEAIRQAQANALAIAFLSDAERFALQAAKAKR